MKTTIKLLAAIILVLATFGQTSAASAADVYKNNGTGANAYFSSLDETGCVITDVYVDTLDYGFKNPPGPAEKASYVYMTISKYDVCTGESLLYAEGFTSLGESELQVSSKQDRATLTATVNVYDWASDSSFDVWVDLTWTGSGPLSRQKTHNQYKVPGCHIVERFTSMSREAQASGTVSDGSTNFTPEPSWWANIFAFKNGVVYVGCN